MNIFKYEGKEFDKKIDELFNNISKEELKNDLIECGLVINTNNYTNINYCVYIDNAKYSKKEKRKIPKTIMTEEYININMNVNINEEENVIWKNSKKLSVA